MQALRSLAIRTPAPGWAHHQHSPLRLPNSCLRFFSASCLRSGHYQTLDIPKNASRNQIKASFYKLSKQYHPDVNDDPSAKSKFQAVSEAYAILGDERKRRAYDRSIAESASHAHTPHEASHPHWSYAGRNRGATHAWEYSRRPNTGPRYTYPPPHGSGSTQYAYHRHPSPSGNPFTNPNVQRATGRKGPLPTDRGPSASDHVARESMFIRTLTVAALILLIASIGHGFSVSAA
ncbi:DnaJ domain-containing protein [Trametes maxima]|nr:DnaJ domain-containing protein [Trametes maxima]